MRTPPSVTGLSGAKVHHLSELNTLAIHAALSSVAERGSESESLRSQSYYSADSQPGGSVSIDFDYGELRAEIAKRHQNVNSGLSVLLIACVAVSILLLRKLALAFRALSQYCRVYQLQLTPRVFLKERQQQAQSRLREEEKLRTLRTGWQEGMRSALPTLTDEQLRRRVQECLEHEAQDLEQMRSLWVEIQERTGQLTRPISTPRHD